MNVTLHKITVNLFIKYTVIWTVKLQYYLNESHPDDTANVILLNDDVSEIRGVHVRLQEQLEKHI